MTWNYVLTNPPYTGDLDINMLEKSYDILSETGKLVIIHPSTMYIKFINDKNLTSKNKKFKALGKKLSDHIKDVEITNYNKEFNISMKFPCAITFIDKEKQKNEKININIFNEKSFVSKVEDINLVGDYNLINSILNKITDESILKHKYNDGDNYNENNYFCKYAGIGRSICADPRTSDVWYRNNLFAYYYWNAFDDRPPKDISNTPIKDLKNGYTYSNPVYNDRCSNNLIGTKTEIENYKYNVYNTNLFVFINIVFTISSSNDSIKFLPWLVDKKYTNDEIYKKYNFTEEEIKLIETTIKKYNKNSDWFKEYMFGKNYKK